MQTKKRKISENIVSYKFIIPLIIPFGLFCIFLSYLPDADNISLYDLMPAILLIGTIYYSFFKYMKYGKNIIIDDEYVYISNCFKTIKNKICKISVIERCDSFFNTPDYIIIKFINTTKFGEKILFIPINDKIYDDLDDLTSHLTVRSRNLKSL